MLSSKSIGEIEFIFSDCVRRTISRLEAEDTNRPFHSSLLTDEVVHWSRFERSFSTSFGQSAIEKISRLVCLGAGASTANAQHDEQVTLTHVQWAAIQDIVRSSRSGDGNYKPNWSEDLKKASGGRDYGTAESRRVRSDLFWVKDGIKNYMSIKTVKPNLDQTAEAKRDLLSIATANPKANVYFGLYYNPFGERREDYSFSPPMRIFDFSADEPILIGRDYWDTLGGVGTYEEVLDIASKVGEGTKSLIRSLGYVDMSWNSEIKVKK